MKEMHKTEIYVKRESDRRGEGGRTEREVTYQILFSGKQQDFNEKQQIAKRAN